MVVSIPLHGFGDVFYHSMVLKFIQKTTNEDVILFCTNRCAYIPEFIDVPYVPKYSKLLKKNLKFSIKDEISFWRELGKYRNAYMFTILYDRIDSFIARKYRFKILEAELNNYYLISNQGLRGVLNYKYSRKGTNPKHFLARMYLSASVIVPITQLEFITQLKLIYNEAISFNSVNKQKRKKNEKIIGIFPDAGTQFRSMNQKQIEFIISYYSKEDYYFEIYTSGNFINLRSENVEIKRFSSFLEVIQDCLIYDIIFTCDSFPAHFSGLSGTKTFVIYNSPQFDKYCECWGAPYNNVFHVEGKSIYSLNEFYIASPIALENNENCMVIDLINIK